MSRPGQSSRLLICCTALIVCQFVSQLSQAGVIRDKLMERRAQQSEMEEEEAATNGPRFKLPPGTRVLEDVAYGSDAKQKMDVYLPASAGDHSAVRLPVIFIVHGGAWAIGSKTHNKVVENKVARWLPKGFIFISINYRMLPQLLAREQAEDVARALAMAQSKAAEWGGDPDQFIIMGHSAGAHLISLLSTSPDMVAQFGVRPWLGSVSLDSAAYDIPAIMATKHYGFYDKAFGTDPAYWRRSSPLHALSTAGAPFLAVCSSKRPDHPCDQADYFVKRANAIGMRASVLPQARSHGDINQQLGLENSYTQAVEDFMASLSPAIRRHLE